LAERWRRPVIPIEIDSGHAEGIWLPDGRVLGSARLLLDGDDVDRMRAGFVCMKCLEPFERSWPERCHVCGFYVRREQAAHFAREYGGIERVYRGLDLNEERERVHEEAAKAEEGKR
jgi:hypothetical protein